METQIRTKELNEFQDDLLIRPDCIVGGIGGEGEIDKDKANIPKQGN